MELIRGDGQPDAVPRLTAFKIAHPDVDILGPADTKSPFWKAYRDGRQLTVQHALSAFVDVLECLAEQNEL